MRALVVYESMFGNSREVAEAVAAGLGRGSPVECRACGEVAASDVDGLDDL